MAKAKKVELHPAGGADSAQGKSKVKKVRKAKPAKAKKPKKAAKKTVKKAAKKWRHEVDTMQWLLPLAFANICVRVKLL